MVADIIQFNNGRLEHRLLKEARLKIGFNYVAIAKKLKVHPANVSYWEHLERYPSKKNQEKLCYLFYTHDIHYSSQRLFPKELEQFIRIMSKKSKQNCLVYLEEIPLEPNYTREPSHRLEQQELYSSLQNALKQLPEYLAKSMHSIYFQEESLTQTGKKFNCPRGTIWAQRKRAVKKLSYNQELKTNYF